MHICAVREFIATVGDSHIFEESRIQFAVGFATYSSSFSPWGTPS